MNTNDTNNTNSLHVALVEHEPSGYRTNLIYMNKTLKTETTFNNHAPEWAIESAFGYRTNDAMCCSGEWGVVLPASCLSIGDG